MNLFSKPKIPPLTNSWITPSQQTHVEHLKPVVCVKFENTVCTFAQAPAPHEPETDSRSPPKPALAFTSSKLFQNRVMLLPSLHDEVR